MLSHRLLQDPRRTALLLGLASAAALGAALVFQYGFDYRPCVMCIWQRWAHVAVIVFAGLSVAFRRWPGVADALLVASGLALLAGAGIAGFHVGVEQHWWAGSSGCGAPAAAGSLDELRAQVFAAPVTRCDEVAWSLFGVSMAGYNALLSLVLAVVALASARIAYVRGAA